MKIYVVLGHTGEYSDHTYWPVCAFKTEAKAQERVTKASRRAAELIAKYKLSIRGHIRDNEYDPSMKDPDYNGIDYDYIEVELEDAEP